MTSAEFVEKALIGTLLNDPTRRDKLPWLGAEDFTDPACRAVWNHLESGTQPRCQPPIDLVELSEVLGRESELHPRLRSPAELATLLIRAPEKPAVLEYARILVEATIRRDVAAIGLRLQNLASGEPEQILDDAASTLASLQALDQRRQASLGKGQQVDTDPRHVPPPWTMHGASPSTGSRSRHHAATGQVIDQQLAERAVIGAAVHDWPPGARNHVLDNVHHSDFTNPRTAATWQALQHLADHHTPIDQITVAWQTLRERNRTGDGLTLQELRQTRDAALLHQAGTTTLTRATISRAATHAQQATSHDCDDLGVDLAEIINSLEAHHATVAAAAQRLTNRPCPHESLAAVKNRLLTRARRPEANPRTTGQPDTPTFLSTTTSPRLPHLST